MTTNLQDTNIDIRLSRTGTFTFTITSGGSIFDLTGYTASAQARLRPDSSDVLFDTTVDTGMSISDGSGGNDFDAGIVVLTVTDEVAATLPEICYYELIGTVSGTKTTLAYGKITRLESVSR